MNNYYPRRPIKSFQDLEVYQKALAISVVVAKRCLFKRKDEIRTLITTELIHRVLKIPLQIAQAHSWRFSEQAKAIQTLEEAMANTNLAIVYLEQYRDICNTDVEMEFFEEQIKELLGLRQKMLYLQRSWKKYVASTV